MSRRILSFPLLSAIAVFAVAAPAPGATFTVDSVADTPDQSTADSICDTNGGGNSTPCTLRAAVTQSAHMSDPDTINFAASFNDDADTINVTDTGGFASLTDDVTINGGNCGNASPKPCVRVHGPLNPATFTTLIQVDGDDSSIRGIAFTRLDAPILTAPSSDRFALRGSWFGLKLDGTATSTETMPGHDVRLDGRAATIGGTTPADRNVFANGHDAVRIQGGDDNVISGNYFGTDPAGGATVRGNDRNILVRGTAGSPDDPATGNVIGGTVSVAAAATPACDDACNMISRTEDGFGSAYGIVLENPFEMTAIPAGQTTIAGNYIGLDPTGTVDRGNSLAGINIGGASNVTVGGPTVREQNKIAFNGNSFPTPPPSAGDAGVLIGEGDSNQVLGNEITSSYGAGILVEGGDFNLVDGNTISNNGLDAIAVTGAATGNLLAVNSGSGNADLFIDLGDDGPGNPAGVNDGVTPPAIATATEGGMTGTAPPGSTVRAFTKASAASGELDSFLGSAVADAAGDWCLAYASPASPGQRATATQTTGTSTSELAPTADSAAGAAPDCSVAASDTDPPETEITDGPPNKTKRKRTSFGFSADEPGSSFECAVDGQAFKATCSPPYKVKVSRGKHSFRVRAIDQAGNVDSSPATDRWKVKKKRRK